MWPKGWRQGASWPRSTPLLTTPLVAVLTLVHRSDTPSGSGASERRTTSVKSRNADCTASRQNLRQECPLWCERAHSWHKFWRDARRGGADSGGPEAPGVTSQTKPVDQCEVRPQMAGSADQFQDQPSVSSGQFFGRWVGFGQTWTGFDRICHDVFDRVSTLLGRVRFDRICVCSIAPGLSSERGPQNVGLCGRHMAWNMVYKSDDVTWTAACESGARASARAARQWRPSGERDPSTLAH